MTQAETLPSPGAAPAPPSPAAVTCDLTVEIRRERDGGYTAETCFSDPRSGAYVGSGPIPVAIDHRALRAAAGDPRGYGDALAATLFADERLSRHLLEALAVAESGSAMLHVRLDLDPRDPALHAVRWETLRDPRPEQRGARLLTGERVLFSRFLTSASFSPVTLASRRDLRALVAVAAPAGLEGLRPGGKTLAAVDRAVEEARAQAALAGVATDVLAGPCTLPRLVDALRGGYDVLYLLCHGALVEADPEDEESSDLSDPRGDDRDASARPIPHEPIVVLEDEAGGFAVVPGPALVEAVAKLARRPTLVLLASCQSARVSEDSALAALGPRLATQAGVPAVVAMQADVGSATASAFASVLFRELLRDGHLPRAVAVARRAVEGEADWWVPVLFSRLVVPRVLSDDPHDAAGAALWDDVRGRALARVAATLEQYTRAGDDYYVARDLEREVGRFVEGGKTIMVVVGQSGMGKTTMVARLMKEYSEQGHLCFFASSAALPTPVAEVEPHLVELLHGGGLAPAEFWRRVDAECARHGRRLVLVVDAVNEYNRAGGGAPRPVDFFGKLDALAQNLARYPNLKLLVTTRPEAWRRGMADGRLRREHGAYHAAGDRLYHELQRYSEAEGHKAYEKYARAPELSIQTPYDALSELTRYHLRDPLLLSLACEVYRGGAIPHDLDTGELFGRYHEHLVREARADGVRADVLLGGFVGELFAPGEGCVVARDALHLPDLAQRDPALYGQLDELAPGSPGVYLRDRNVLRYEGDQVRFMYDRFAEFLMAGRLHEHLAAPSGDPGARALATLRDNLPGAQRLSTVFGALQRVLLLLAKGDRAKVEYPFLVRRLAQHDESGQALVVSVLARIAMLQPDGIDILHDTLRASDDGGPALRGAASAVEVVYRVLVDEEYRHWLVEQTEDERRRHRRVLHAHFVWGMTSRESESAATVQYLFFLWRNPLTRPEAADVLRTLLAGHVRPLSLRSWFGEQRRLLQNLVSFFFLALAEARDEDEVRELLPIARDTVRRAKLERRGAFVTAAVWLVSIRLTLSLLTILRTAPNPVNVGALAPVTRDPALNRAYNDVLDLLDPACNLTAESPERLRALARTDNGIVLELMSLALSAHYERQADDAGREAVLGVVERLFRGGEPDERGEYCVALALYHVNYFCAHPSARSMALMGEVVRHVLAERGGWFHLAGAPRSHNVIGTYGRALRRTAHLLGDRGAEGFAFAVEALERAKASGDAAFYLYVSENVGLLGVLTDPQPVFEVMTHVLRDLGELSADEQGRPPLPFDAARRAEVRRRVLQGLANVRVLHRREVDRYLLEQLESPRLYAEVALKTRPEVQMGVFYSWTFEQLMFRILTRYYGQIGAKVLDTFRRASRERSTRAGIHQIMREITARLAELAA